MYFLTELESRVLVDERVLENCFGLGLGFLVRFYIVSQVFYEALEHKCVLFLISGNLANFKRISHI